MSQPRKDRAEKLVSRRAKAANYRKVIRRALKRERAAYEISGAFERRFKEAQAWAIMGWISLPVIGLAFYLFG